MSARLAELFGEGLGAGFAEGGWVEGGGFEGGEEVGGGGVMVGGGGERGCRWWGIGGGWRHGDADVVAGRDSRESGWVGMQ